MTLRSGTDPKVLKGERGAPYRFVFRRVSAIQILVSSKGLFKKIDHDFSQKAPALDPLLEMFLYWKLFRSVA